MRGRFHAAIAVALVVLTVGGLPADAAIRRCGAQVSSDVQRAGTELAAKKLALDQWKDRALQQGAGHDNWRIAAERALKCLPAASGGFECVATAAPCVIEQNPRRTPSGPQEKGVGI